jgi:mono/diheme cytochrome c family protein
MFERMLVGKIENRITVGIVCFVGIMVLLGWAAINEGGRMASLDETYHARSIEAGALLFTANCTRCHGPDGRGLNGYAPGLNNPMIFGVDFYPEVTSQISDLEAEQIALNAENGLPATTDARKAEIKTRLDEIAQKITELDAPRQQALQAAIDKGYDPQRPDRLKNLGWVGTRDAFILTTLIHGRPTSINYWPNGAMPAWSQTAGGPLRTDQLEDLVAYVENFDKGDQWTMDDLFAVIQFAKEPVDPIYKQQAESADLPKPVGTDVTAALDAISGLTGDPTRGSQLYHNQAKTQLLNALPCSGCHTQTANGTGPMADGTDTRVETIRLQDPALAGYTNTQYIVESILQPSAYIVPGFQDLMLKNLGEQMSAQDLADIVAYLESLK